MTQKHLFTTATIICLLSILAAPFASSHATKFAQEPLDLTRRHKNCFTCHEKPASETKKNQEESKVGEIKKRLIKNEGKINHFTSKPYRATNMVCITCHNKIHRKFGHPIGVKTKQLKFIHISPAYASAAGNPRLKRLDCKVCHDIHTDSYKYLIGIENDEEVQKLCAPCHPEQAIPLPKNESNQRNQEKRKLKK